MIIYYCQDYTKMRPITAYRGAVRILLGTMEYENQAMEPNYKLYFKLLRRLTPKLLTRLQTKCVDLHEQQQATCRTTDDQTLWIKIGRLKNYCGWEITKRAGVK